jgi:hypothetical protein
MRFYRTFDSVKQSGAIKRDEGVDVYLKIAKVRRHRSVVIGRSVGHRSTRARVM